MNIDKIEIGLCLGANLGDRLLQLQTAKKRIIATRGVSFVTQSPVYETEPVDVPAMDADMFFLNAVLIVETLLPAPELLSLCKCIEHQMGRAPDSLPKNARRPIDIDIIYAGNLHVESEDITVPHPRWFKRRFVVQPLSDVRPDLVIPAQTTTVNEILRYLPDKHRVTLSLPADEW